MRHMNFRGCSGQAYGFRRVDPNSMWAAEAGIVLFAARSTFGWRIVRMSGLQGRLHDIQPIWAFADAQRYGARAVFVLLESSQDRRRAIMADLKAGLDPVFSEPLMDQRMAA